MSPLLSDGYPDWQSCFSEPILTSAAGWFSGGEVPGWLLDLGCSGGNRSSCLPCRMHRVGVDTDLASLRVAAKRYPGASFLAADAASLPFRDCSFDAIFSYSVMQYVDRERATTEAGRVLRDDGRAAVVENSAGYRPARILRWLSGMRRKGRGRALGYFDPMILSLYGGCFSVERVERFHLLSPLAAIPSALAAWISRKPIRPPSLFLFRMLTRVDSLLMRKGSEGGWLVLLLLRKKFQPVKPRTETIVQPEAAQR